MIAVTLPPLALLACCLVSVTAAQAQTSVRDASSSLTSREEACYSTEAESLKPLGKKFVKNFLLDQKDIWTSPFHMKRSDAKWWLLFGTATGALIATDHPRLSPQNRPYVITSKPANGLHSGH
jgi:hypothetical protein